MVEGIAAFDEIRCIWFYAQLNFACNMVFKSDINEDIIGAISETILYADNLQ
jgi:hypothetical protein